MLSYSEVCRHQKVSGFAANQRNGSWVYAWVHKRGVFDKASSDGGQDLVVMPDGGFPQVVISGAKSISSPSFSTDGRFVVAQDGKQAVIGSADSLQVQTWLTLEPGETFEGAPTWMGDVVLFATCGGTSKRSRLHMIAAPAKPTVAADLAARRTLFTAEHGGGLMSWDRKPVAPHDVLLVHRLANSMLAELVLVTMPETGEGAATAAPRVIARDGRVEYCRPQAAFLADGRILARLNLARGEAEAGGTPRDITHGLWLLDPKDVANGATGAVWAPIGGSWSKHGTYDVCSSSYANAHGVPEGFILDASRERVAFTMRAHDPQYGMHDSLLVVPTADFASEGVRTSPWAGPAVSAGVVGCHVPVALAGETLVFHFRSPTDWGDLWKASLAGQVSEAAGTRLTHTMPASLRAKLSPPEQLIIGGRHALLYRPPDEPSDDAPQGHPALVWAHGGPMTAFGFDFNPIASWLASLGYLVCVPNFVGSTGFGIAHMDGVFGDGCGVADLDDCVACADYLRRLDGVDARRGIGIAGHSWGGYLALRAMTAPRAKDAFSCGIACAGIADWFCQQRHTEVRYYDYALMGGWVYEADVRARAKEASPLTHAAELKAPLLVLHGEADIDVPFAQAKAFVEAARGARRADDPTAPALEFASFAGEGHGMGGWSPATQADALGKMRDFLRIHLKPWDFTDNPHGDLTAY